MVSHSRCSHCGGVGRVVGPGATIERASDLVKTPCGVHACGLCWHAHVMLKCKEPACLEARRAADKLQRLTEGGTS